MKPTKIIFAGTPEFAAVALESLIREKNHLVAVYTQPDRPAGRGRKVTASPVKQLAQEHGLAVEQPINFKDPAALQHLQDYQPDLMVVAAYGLLLPEAVLRIPKYGCINIHASLLPRWRGAAPIQRALLAGDEVTGITIMQMDVGLDTGDILLARSTPVSQQDTASSLHDRLARLGADALLETLSLLPANQLKPIKQDNQLATYAKKLAKHEAWINWLNDAEGIHRQIRAFNPWPIAQTCYAGQIIRIHQADILGDSDPGRAGEVLQFDQSGLRIQCGQGGLRVTQCQLPGSRAMPIADLYNGHPELFIPGTCFDMPPQVDEG